MLGTGIPFLEEIDLRQSSDPNLFNTLFSYPNHFQQVRIKQADAYPIDQTLDRRSTRNVKIL